MNLTINLPEVGRLADAILKLADEIRLAGTREVRVSSLLAPAVLKMAAAPEAPVALSPADNPATGAPGHVPLVPDTPLALTPAPVATAADPAAVFGSAAAPVPLAPPAPSTAVAAVVPTAPAAPAALVPTPPTAPSAPAPLPANVAHAPLVPAAPTSPAGAAGVDRNGLPWDGRIHAANRSTNQDGSWRKRRGVEDAEVVRIEAELRQAVAANRAVAAPLAPPTPVVAPAAAPAPQPTIAQQPAAAPAPGGITFGQLAMKIEAPILNKTLSWDSVSQVLATVGLQSFNQLMHASALVPLVDAELSKLIGVAPGAA